MTQLDPKSWPQILDEFERALEWHEEQLAIIDSESAPGWANPWAPPIDVGSIPAELRSRAEDLLERSANLETSLVEKMASVSPGGATMQRRRHNQTRDSSSTFSTKL